MTMRPSTIWIAWLSTALLSAATAADYFVGRSGSDTNTGLTRAAAFATVQKGVDALAPGDSLTILPGEYLEHVRRAGLGDTNAVTVIRAETPGTVVLRGDVPVSDFQKVEGYRFVFVTDFPGEASVPAVIEQDTLRVLPGQPNMAQLEMVPGSFFHDVNAGKLYVSASALTAAPEHDYTATIIPTHGFYLSKARRVILEGLSATAFQSSEVLHHTEGTLGSVWGIFLNDSSGCTIRNCRAWFNGGGIGLNSGDSVAGDNVVEHCTAWANVNHNSPEDLGGVTIFAGRRDTIRNCTAFLNGKYGINIYGTGTDGGPYGEWQVPGNEPENKSRLIENLAWGNYCDFKIKTGVRYFHTIERCVGPGLWSVAPSNVTRSLIGRSTRDFGRDTIVLSQETNLNLQAEFVDPDRHDYRLRADSRFRGTGPSGSDRGPYPYEPGVASAIGSDPLRSESTRYNVPPAQERRMAGPFAHTVSDTTANFNWWVSAPGGYRVSWGETPERTNSIALDSAAAGSFSLAGLQPNRQYHLRIAADEPFKQLPLTNGPAHRGLPADLGRAGPTASITTTGEPHWTQAATGLVTAVDLTFRTAAEPLPPRTLYVATGGDDANDGLSRRHAWRTVQHAANQVRPGDTVLIGGGTYSEAVRIMATGARDRPITFKALPGEKVTFDGLGRNLAFAFLASHKSFLHFDGFYFKDFALVTADAPWSHRWSYLNGAINLYRGNDISVTRCFMDGRGPGYSPGLVMAMHTANVTVRNNVIIRAMGQAVTIYWNSPGARVENNVFLVSLITQTGIQVDRRFISTPSDFPRLTRNIITDNLAKKAHVPLLYNNDVVQTRENCFFLRVPPEQRVGSKTGQSMADFLQSKAEDGTDLGNIAADPRFAGDPGVPPEPERWRGYSPDHMLNWDFPLDFDFLFATNPELIERGIGLEPEAFADFHFNRPDAAARPSPCDVARITVSHNPAHIPRLVDGNPSSAWTSGMPQEEGMWLDMRFARPKEITSITMDCGTGYPGAYALYIDGGEAKQNTAALVRTGEEGQTTINLPAGHPTLTLKIVLTEPRPKQWWSIRELRINGHTPVAF